MTSEPGIPDGGEPDTDEAREQTVDDMLVQLIQADKANASIQEWVSHFGSTLPAPMLKAISDLDLALRGEADDDWRTRDPDTWRSKAAAKLKWLDVVDKMEDKALRDLCMALRQGLTAEQQRTVAQDLLGESHVGMLVEPRELRPGEVGPMHVRILVPARDARSLIGGGRYLSPNRTDPWWEKH